MAESFKVKFRSHVAEVKKLGGKSVHAGKWTIYFRNDSGVLEQRGVYKDEKKARAKALEILREIERTVIDVSSITAEEIYLLNVVRDKGLNVDDIIRLASMKASKEEKLLPSVRKEFLESEVAAGSYSKYQEGDYKKITRAFADRHMTREMWSLGPDEILAFAATWKVGAKRHNNKRLIMVRFWQWAVDRGYSSSNFAKAISTRRLGKKKGHDIYSPSQLIEMFRVCPECDIPWLALSAFAGCRGVEIYGKPEDRSTALKWEDFDWDNKRIVMRPETEKTTRNSSGRIIPMCDALIDWLSPWRKSSGLVHAHLRPTDRRGKKEHQKSTSSVLGEAVGGWKKNALRASRASYRLAITKDISLVKLEMGHSEQMLLGDYNNTRLAEAAEEWFSITRVVINTPGDKIVKLG